MPKKKPDIKYYGHGNMQLIDFLESSFTPSEFRGYLRGNILKYLVRYRYKGTPIADLTKAQTYLAWLMEFEETRPASETQSK